MLWRVFEPPFAPGETEAHKGVAGGGKYGGEEVSHTGLAQAEAGSGCVTHRGTLCAVVPRETRAGSDPARPSQAVNPQRAGGGGAWAGLPGSGASDKGLKGLGAPERCDKAAVGV